MKATRRIATILFASVPALSLGQPQTPPPERCDVYARIAVNQYRAAMSSPECRIGPSPRWQGSFDAHHDWCLQAPDAALIGESRARREHLERCGGAPNAGAGPASRPPGTIVNPPPGTPATTVVRVDDRCDQYARGAVNQFRAAQRNPSCRIGPNGRWQDNYDAHYNWCLRAPDTALGNESYARSQHLRQCAMP